MELPALAVSIGVIAVVIWVTSRWAAGREAKALLSREGSPDANQTGGAGFWIRVAARMCDTLLILLVFTVGVFIAALLEAANLVSGRVWAACLLVPPATFVAYFTVLTARSGQTWGKRLAGVRVDTTAGARLGWGRSLGRAVADVAFSLLESVYVGLADPLWIVVSRRKRALHDLIAGSQVRTVRVSSRALPWVASLGFLAPFVVVFLFIRPFAAQAFRIPSRTMAPTLKQGDRMLVNKLAYRVSSVERGDVIVFDAPKAALLRMAEPVTLVKRVVGVPGDRVQIKAGGGIYVNGERLDPHPVAVPEYDWPVSSAGEAAGEPYAVPPGNYFVLGDNCNASNDSHRWRDPVTGRPAPDLPRERILGKVSVRFWPPVRIGEVR